MYRKDFVSKSPFKHPWWSPFGGIGDSIRCLDERLIVELSNQIRAKPAWTTKYKNSDIVSKWRNEFDEQEHKSEHVGQVFDYVIRELEWYDKVESTRPEFSDKKFKIGPDDRIVFSDGAIDDKTAKSLASGVAEFEKVTPKDYHPGSDNLVVDLVHPSLFHLEYGRTKALNDGQLEVVEFNEEIPKFKKGLSEWGISKRFQWLPAELDLDKDSKTFSFGSYINNLHPLKYSNLYESIAEVFNQVVPGLNFSLARYLSEEYVRVPIPNYSEAYKEGFSDWEEKFWENYDHESFDESAHDEERKEFLRDFPPTYSKDPVTKDFDVRDFSKLKVVVKLANIELTPEKPKYAGGSWHVEGTINEDIVATVLYYYDIENIKDSKLSFRGGSEDPNYEQGDTLYCEHFFGLKDEDKMTKFVGSVDAEEGRVIIFPNFFQHHVDPFELADPLKPGKRKILCFFFVDPHNDLVKSTRDVPPQNKEWVNDKELLDKYFPGVNLEEIATMTWEEALKARDELMAERTAAQDGDDEWDFPYTRSFSLCEH
ncbi:CIC11C00000005104 [Sungouiella intermedia]|uniref:CIC11C00000005104 n=1 Tax=Sungouiella intermedia TaxID=45354 RepID=A0A1L0BG13_9ASCO|nr:CIC11C00000005104 [[Candida] intermedia]